MKGILGNCFVLFILTDEETQALRRQGRGKFWEDGGGSGKILNHPKFCHKNRNQLRQQNPNPQTNILNKTGDKIVY